MPLSNTCNTMQDSWVRSTSPSKRQKKALPPPPPKSAPPPITLEVRKRSPQDRLGVRFLADGGSGGGAIIDSVEPYGPAWRAKLRPGDTLMCVISGGKEVATDTGYRAAEVLRPLSGVFGVRVRRPRMSKPDAAAVRLQAASVGYQVRLGFGDAKRASLLIQTYFRRFSAMLLSEERHLALRYIQCIGREHIERQRRRTGSRRPSIRAPAQLLELE